MEIHCLSLRVIAFFGYPATVGAQFIIGINRTIARNELHRPAGAQQALKAENLIKQSWIDGFYFIRAEITEKMVKSC